MNKAKPKKRNKSQTPILNSLIVRGLVEWDDTAHQYTGKASDGVLVFLGHDPVSAERYLTAHPEPKNW